VVIKWSPVLHVFLLTAIINVATTTTTTTTTVTTTATTTTSTTGAAFLEVTSFTDSVYSKFVLY
jgi:hypothetical protein